MLKNSFSFILHANSTFFMTLKTLLLTSAGTGEEASGQEHALLFQRTRVLFPALTLGDSYLPVAPDAGDPMPSSSLYGHLYMCHRYTYI